MSTVLDRPTMLTLEIIDELTRRQLVQGAVAVTALSLAACGTGESPEPAPVRSRTVTGADGPVQVPLEAQRVVALDPVTTEHLAALNVDAVGATVEGFFEPLSVLQPGATHVLDADGPNLEVIAGLRPDVVLGWPPFAEGFESELATLAPYLGTLREGYVDWAQDLRFVAGALGLESRADSVLARYDARLVQVRELVAVAFAGQRVSILRTQGDGKTLVLVARGAVGASIADAAGLPRPASGLEVPAGSSEDVARNGEYEISAEQLDLLDADQLILITYAPGDSPEEQAQLEALEANPLWRRLRFAQTGAVHRVPLGSWLQGSVIAAGRVLDDLERIAAAVRPPS